MTDSLRNLARLLRYYPRVLRMVWDANPKYALLSMLLTIASAAVPPLQVWLSKTIIDQVVDTVQSSAQGVPLD